MAGDREEIFLLASGEPALLAAMEPVLLDLKRARAGPQADDERVRVAMTAEAALQLMLKQVPALALLDTRLMGMELGRLLAAVRAEEAGRRFPIVLISDTLSEELKDRLAEGLIDDVVPPETGPDWMRARVEMVLRCAERERELERLREQAVVDARKDPLTGAYNRTALMEMLFRETDRVQRMNTSLCAVLFDIDDFGHWNARLGTAACDELLLKVVERLGGLLRSYDMLGRVGKDEFLTALPGCSTVNAAMLTERIRAEVFGEPFLAAGRMVRLSACFAVVASRGRSPVVVLREAEEMLRLAKADGPETIQCVQQREAGAGSRE
jgi:diguanylate cyclase (GGDEF)-like protein